VLRKLIVPPRHALIVQASTELRSDAEEPLLVRQLEAQPLADEGWIEIPIEGGKASRAEAVRLVPIEPVGRRSVRELGTCRPAHGVPDVRAAMGLRHVEAEVVAIGLERRSGSTL